MSSAEYDIIFISGDPPLDHPLNGVAVLSRLLESKGYRVGLISRPQSDADFLRLGMPRLFFCVTSGLLDSMLANYTPLLRKRDGVDVPERAVILYANRLRQVFQSPFIVIGGVEATLRRFAHFDYWDNAVRRSILLDSKADALIFGNAERSILEFAACIKALRDRGLEGSTLRDAREWRFVRSIAARIRQGEFNGPHPLMEGVVELPSFEEVSTDKKRFARSAQLAHYHMERPFLERTDKAIVFHNPPVYPLTEEEMDAVFEQPYTRAFAQGYSPTKEESDALDHIKNSVVMHRGCWGGCHFCTIPLQQGKPIARRSKESIVREIRKLASEGTTKVQDLVAPTTNMYGSSCTLYNRKVSIHSPILGKDITVLVKDELCNERCVGCAYRKSDERPLIDLLIEIEKITEIDVEIRSAIRHDIILSQPLLFRKIMEHTTRLKIAPEHTRDSVLAFMNKASSQDFIRFLEEFRKVNLEQHTHKNLVPYFVAAHPGTTREDMEAVYDFAIRQGLFVNLTQVFTPTPGTISTAMYHTGIHPLTTKEVYVPRTFREKKDQKNILLGAAEQGCDDAL